jgi:hypothetical protein
MDSMVSSSKTLFDDLPNGCVIRYRKHYYWLSKGMDGRIVSQTDGYWHFVSSLNWRKYEVVFNPSEHAKKTT